MRGNGLSERGERPAAASSAVRSFGQKGAGGILQRRFLFFLKEKAPAGTGNVETPRKGTIYK